MRDYIDIAGIPSLVRLGSDYGYVEEALKPLGKKLKSVAFGLMGKRVVDI